MSGGLISSQEGMSRKIRMKHSSLFVTIDYAPFDFDGHPIFQLGSILMRIILNQTTRRQTLWRSVHLETDITTYSRIGEIDT